MANVISAEGIQISRLQRAIRQWRALFAIYFQDGIAYRASGFIWILTDVSSAVTMPLVWAAAARTGPIQGFQVPDFVLYYLTMMLLSSFIVCHYMWDISFEIREGNFTMYLIRPVSYFQTMLVRNLSWRIVRTMIFMPVFLLLLWAYWGFLGPGKLYLGWETWISIILGHLLSLTFVMAMAMLALFITEAHAVFELYYVPMLFLSGQLFPVALLPDWAKNIALFFPFYYTVGLPTEMAIGRIQPGVALPLIGAQLLWVAGSWMAYRWLWAFGLRHYTGVGM